MKKIPNVTSTPKVSETTNIVQEFCSNVPTNSKTSDFSIIAKKNCSYVTLSPKPSDSSNVAQKNCSNVTILTQMSENSNFTENIRSNVTNMSSHSTIATDDCSKLSMPLKKSDIPNIANGYCSNVTLESDNANLASACCSETTKETSNNLSSAQACCMDKDGMGSILILSDNPNVAQACCSKSEQLNVNSKLIDNIEQKFTGTVPKAQKFGLNRVEDSPPLINEIDSELPTSNLPLNVFNVKKVFESGDSSQNGERWRYCAPKVLERIENYEETVKKIVVGPKYKISPKIKRSIMDGKTRLNKANSGQKVRRKGPKNVPKEVLPVSGSDAQNRVQASLPNLAKNGPILSTVKSPKINSGKVTCLLYTSDAADE